MSHLTQMVQELTQVFPVMPQVKIEPKEVAWLRSKQKLYLFLEAAKNPDMKHDSSSTFRTVGKGIVTIPGGYRIFLYVTSPCHTSRRCGDWNKEEHLNGYATEVVFRASTWIETGCLVVW